MSFGGSCKVLKGALPESTDITCGQAKGPARNWEVCWRNNNVKNSVSGKCKFKKEWK